MTAPSGARGGGPGTTTLSDGPRTALFVVDVQDGVQPDSCLRSTLHGALARGDDALLVSDPHTTEDLTAHGAPPPAQVVAHTDLYRGSQAAPGRTPGTATTAEVDLGASPCA